MFWQTRKLARTTAIGELRLSHLKLEQRHIRGRARSTPLSHRPRSPAMVSGWARRTAVCSSSTL